jgi:hypothetical protein
MRLKTARRETRHFMTGIFLPEFPGIFKTVTPHVSGIAYLCRF